MTMTAKAKAKAPRRSLPLLLGRYCFLQRVEACAVSSGWRTCRDPCRWPKTWSRGCDSREIMGACIRMFLFCKT
ncbi:uncharacterized protein B0J16DRAFT_342152 [Fusarium flagelliforme]|uniref:uncharacterized protein n=1 Tax=Fusarium flagelliforme TaxID=2675880 RepID=UPI001E8D3BD1|nr:uncharacterized protein B0J16DRAFT_342152 [Fusarium flagelliforme]KAH7185609.1 hypothetical protein B0J16DRAFT_342152 [Fusarium flagelliforme]